MEQQYFPYRASVSAMARSDLAQYNSTICPSSTAFPSPPVNLSTMIHNKRPRRVTKNKKFFLKPY